MARAAVLLRGFAGRKVVRRALPWVAGAIAVQAVLRGVGRLAARRLNTGGDGAASVRRVATFGQLALVPSGPAPADARFDLAFAGAEVDLTGAEPRPGGTDVTFNCLFGGGSVRLPADWRVAWDRRGIGGVGIGRNQPIERSGDPAGADLRIHLRAVFGGVGLTT